MRRIGPIALGLLMAATGAAGADGAELQLRPFVAATFSGSTTFFDPDNAVGKPNGAIGVGVLWLGDVVGVEGDIGWAPGFFQPGPRHLVLHSAVTTATGSIVLAVPRRLTEYTLRPYLVAGAGLIRVNIDDVFQVLPVTENLVGMNIGGGVIGFLTNRVGLAWDVRRYGTLKGSPAATGIVIGDSGRISFWRAYMALVLRY